ncbi:toll-like receptor 4 [Liolophura sinensis]|uniref:toll-like receptor 4 n=1 Tax=Liolophura sinensis TaxID=3198878 RepID=UPI0031583CF6
MLRCSKAAVFVFLTSLSGSFCSECHYDKTTNWLDCRRKKLRSVPTELFSADLRGIDLSFNGILFVENRTFVKVPKLQTLDLSYNLLDVLQPAAFFGLENLISLNLSNSELEINPELLIGLFEPLVSLEVICIQQYLDLDVWQGIDTAFNKLKKLTTLFFDFPHEFTFGVGFEELTKLTKISTFEGEIIQASLPSKCEWSTIKNETFVIFQGIAIKELTLAQCEIKIIESRAFYPLSSLEVLDLSFNVQLGLRNSLLSLQGAPFNMTTINMENVNGDIAHVGYKLEAVDFMHLSKICVDSLDLSRNFIFYDERSDNPVRLRLDCLVYLNMSEHRLSVWPSQLMQYLRNSPRLTYLDFSRSGYRSSRTEDLINSTPWQSSRNNSAFIILPPSLAWFSFSGCEDWFVAKGYSAVILAPNLRYFGAAYINLKLCSTNFGSETPNLSHLDISGARCKMITSFFFQNFRKLTTLSLSSCPNMYSVVNIKAKPAMFNYLEALEEIDLSRNMITDLDSELFVTNQKLTFVNLSRNKLQRLPLTLYHLSTLKKLDLSFNAFTHFRLDEMKQLDMWIAQAEYGQPFQVLMGDNPLQCSCETVIFVQWLLQRTKHFDNVDKYKCLLSNGTWVTLHSLKLQLMDFQVKCVSHTYLIISVVGILVLIFVVLLFVVVNRYRLNLRYWLYTKLTPPENMFVDHEYIYDAFVAYTSDEYEWVIRQLRPKLELVDDPVQLCVHDRDFIPGKPIHENIVEKMKESRKILLIISPAFLDSTYGPLEIEYAGMKCLEEGRDDIILCVLMEDISVRQMPRALRNLWHKITFLKWSADPEAQIIFWRNLKAALSRTEQ